MEKSNKVNQKINKMGFFSKLKRILLFWKREKSDKLLGEELRGSVIDQPNQILKEKKIIHEFKPSGILEEIKLPEQRRIYDYSNSSLHTVKDVLKPISNRIVNNILGIEFIFDKESYKLFKEEFAEDTQWEIAYDDQGCYLMRQKKNGYFEYFHRWLMSDKIEEFAKKKRIRTSEVIVHHQNHNHTDNRIPNLVLMTRKEHHEYHKKEKAYQNWNGSRKNFEEWYFNSHKDF